MMMAFAAKPFDSASTHFYATVRPDAGLLAVIREEETPLKEIV
jgi:hypothetical protein